MMRPLETLQRAVEADRQVELAYLAYCRAVGDQSGNTTLSLPMVLGARVAAYDRSERLPGLIAQGDRALEEAAHMYRATARHGASHRLLVRILLYLSARASEIEGILSTDTGLATGARYDVGDRP